MRAHAREGRGREAAEPPTHSIADGTALHRGRVGSRHFQKPLGFVLGASLFVGVIIPFPAAAGISCAWAKARVTTGTALVKRYALPYAFPTNNKICGDPRKCIKCPSKSNRRNEVQTTSREVYRTPYSGGEKILNKVRERSEHLVREKKSI